MTLQRVFPGEMVAAFSANERLLTTAATHSLICMSMGIVGVAKSLTAALWTFDTP
jgi:hypothetical protein